MKTTRINYGSVFGVSDVFSGCSRTYILSLIIILMLKQAKFDAARHGPQIVGAGPEDKRGPSMYIATSYDFGCKTWTHESPSQQVTFCSYLS